MRDIQWDVRVDTQDTPTSPPWRIHDEQREKWGVLRGWLDALQCVKLTSYGDVYLCICLDIALYPCPSIHLL